MVTVGQVLLDGTKIKANAVMHKAMSDERMVAEEKHLKAEIEERLEQVELDQLAGHAGDDHSGQARERDEVGARAGAV